MKLIDNKLFKLPSLTGGPFKGMDRLLIPHKDLILIKVNRRDDNGNIKLICQAKDGPEIKTGWIKFNEEATSEQKHFLFIWLSKLISQNIDKIYNSDFVSN